MGRRKKRGARDGQPPAQQDPRAASAPLNAGAAGAPPPRGWWRSKRPILKPILIFAAVMFAYYAGDYVSMRAGGGLRDRYLEWIARTSSGILGWLGQETSAAGTAIWSSGFSVRIVRGCDALEPTAAFVAAVLASPVALMRKLPGLAVGVPGLLLINLVRVVSLFLLGEHYPKLFETVHYEVWQAAFIVLAVLFWAIWVQWATRERRARAAT